MVWSGRYVDFSSPKERIEEIYKERGMSRRKFAVSLGYAPTGMAGIFSGRGTVTQALANSIELNYGYSTEWILTGKLPKESKMVEKSQTKVQTVKEKDTKPEIKVRDIGDIEEIVAIGKKYECQSLRIGDLEVCYRLPSVNMQQPMTPPKDIDEDILFYASSG